MIKFTTPSKTPLSELAAQLPRRYRVGFRRAVENDVLPLVQEALFRDLVNDTPPARTKASPKFIWSRNKAANKRARGWWFANIAKGNINTNGSNYVRTGGLQKRWRVYFNVTTNDATITLENRSRGAKYVYGNKERPQIPGHKTTGWKSVNRQIAGKRRTLDAGMRRVARDIAARALGAK